jgi:hypothetical protein
VGPLLVVLAPIAFTKHPALGDSGEQRSVQKLVSEATVEALPESVLPRTAWVYVIV